MFKVIFLVIFLVFDSGAIYQGQDNESKLRNSYYEWTIFYFKQ